MSGPVIIRLSEWRHRERARLAKEAEDARHKREASERLRRLLDGDWPPFGGSAA